MSDLSDQMAPDETFESGAKAADLGKLGLEPHDKLTFLAAPVEQGFTGERYVSDIQGPIQYEHYHRYVFARPYCAGKNVLDIACGEGYGSAFLAGVAQSVVGVDIADDAVDAARRAFGRKNLRYAAGSCTAIPLPDASIDVIVSFETLEHFAEQDLFFEECKRVLRPGGVIIVSTPDKTIFSPPGSAPNEYHVRELTRAEFEAMLAHHFEEFDLVGQSPMVGSLITPIRAASAGMSYLEETSPRTYSVGTSVNRPMYLIAVVGAKATEGLQLLNGASRAVSLFAEASQKASFLENEVVRIHHEFALRETEIGRLNAVQTELIRALKASEEQTSELQKGRIELTAALHAAERQVLDQGRELQQRERRLHEKSVQVEQHRAFTSNLEGETRQLRTAVEAMRQHLDALQASTTWKISWGLARVGERMPTLLRRTGRMVFRGVWRSYRSLRIRPSSARATPPSTDPAPVPSPAVKEGRPRSMITAPAVSQPYQPPITLTSQDVLLNNDASADLCIIVLLDSGWLLPDTVEALRPAASMGAEIVICSPYASTITGAVPVVAPLGKDLVLHLDQTLRGVNAPLAVVVTHNMKIKPDSFNTIMDVFAQSDLLAAVNGWLQPSASGEACETAKFVHAIDTLEPGLLCFDLDVYKLVGGLHSAGGDLAHSLKDYSARCATAGFFVGMDPFLAAWPSEEVKLVSAVPLPRRARARALISDVVIPTPDQDCGSLNLVWNIRILQSFGYECTFLPTHRRDDLHSYADALRRMGVRCVVAAEYGDFRRYAEEHASEFELVMLFKAHSASQLMDCVRQFAPKAKIIYNTVDLHFLREQRAADLAKSAEMMAAAENTKREELRLMREADATIIVSSYEMGLVQNLAPETKSFWIPIVNPIAGLQAPAAGRTGVMFVGGFAHHPNVDAMLYFLSDIWPRVRSLAPLAELFIIGSSAPPELLALGQSTDGVTVVGFVENLGPWYQLMRVNIAPLRYGGGVKGKIISSLSVGLPTVGTSIAVEGMGLTHGVDVMVADSEDVFAQAIVELCVDDDKWTSMARASVASARKSFSVEAVTNSLGRLLEDLSLPH